MKLKNEDVEAVEFLYDRLVRVYEECYNNDYLINARKAIDVMRQKVNGDSASQDQALHKHDVSVSLPELKKKLLSMRFTKKQTKECDQQGTFIAYGWTDCLNKLLEWVKTKGNER